MDTENIQKKLKDKTVSLEQTTLHIEYKVQDLGTSCSVTISVVYYSDDQHTSVV